MLFPPTRSNQETTKVDRSIEESVKDLLQKPVSIETVKSLFPNGEWRGSLPVQFSSVTDDSRNVTGGSMFIAIVGFESDGHLYLHQALDSGASLLIVDAAHIEANPALLESVPGAPLLLIGDTRRVASFLAAEFYGHPSKQINVHGITGTKGKTTTVHLLADILKAAGRRPALIGTLGVEFNGEMFESKLTTPGPIDFQHWLRFLADKGATDVIAEVSAHSGALARTASVNFQSVTYMNLSRDHGDHFTPEAYLDAKLAIARDAAKVNPNVYGIANIRDPHAEAFLEPVESGHRIRFATFEEGENPFSVESEIHVQIVARSWRELSIVVKTLTWGREIALPLIGRFNAQNAAAAASIAMAASITPDQIADGLAHARQIPGRLERIDLAQDFLVVVDYAHAPQPASEVLSALREITPGRLIGVMGAGGSRDRGKRPMIGEVMASDCDICFITSDNPRKEEPLDIINDILVGVQRVPDGMKKTIIEPDRAKAINQALEEAHSSDTVAILGKGHENYQIFKDYTIHFDDREVARDWLLSHGYGA
jgi:UDP-N-acetylmuramoyl-L-alanyl-D-glutamate--2,6-diaminopimelate ligase